MQTQMLYLSILRKLKTNEPEVMVAALNEGEAPAEGGDGTKERQRQDPWIAQMAKYLEIGTLPAEEKVAREMALTKEQYTMKEGILYKVERDKMLWYIPAAGDRRKLFDEAHSGALGGHLRESKMHQDSTGSLT